MTLKVDLNADMGESFGPWKMGNDAALLDVVTSANIACGFHAGDPDVMAQTMGLAVEKDVGIGAHPGFADLQGFGRRRLAMSPRSLSHMITYQMGAAQAMAEAAGGTLRHFKLHGALANWASEDAEVARCCYQAALAYAPDINIFVLAATEMETVVRALGCSWSGEIFADRAYMPDGQLAPRSRPDAMIHDPDIALSHSLTMLTEHRITAIDGTTLPITPHSLCVHGDGASAVAMAKHLQAGLTNAGLTAKTLPEMML